MGKRLLTTLCCLGLLTPFLCLASTDKLADYTKISGLNNTRLFRIKNVLYAVEPGEEGLIVWQKSRDGEDFTEVNTNFSQDSNNTAVTSFAIKNNFLYLSTENKNGPQIWRAFLGRKGSWKKIKTFAAGEKVRDLYRHRNRLYVNLENSESQAEVWVYYQNNWTQLNEPGLGYNVSTISDAVWIELNDKEYYVLATKQGNLATDDTENLSSFTRLLDDQQTFTALGKMKGYLYAAKKGTTEKKPSLWRTRDGLEWQKVFSAEGGATQIGPIFKSWNTWKRKLIFKGKKLVFAVTNDNGVQLYKTKNGKNFYKFIDGLGDDSTKVYDFIRVRNRKHYTGFLPDNYRGPWGRYLSTDDGIFLVQPRKPLAPVITEPQDEAVIRRADLTVSGKAKARSKVHLWLDNEYQGKAKVNKNRRWSYDLEDLTAGEHILKVRARKNGLKSSYTEITFTVELSS